MSSLAEIRTPSIHNTSKTPAVVGSGIMTPAQISEEIELLRGRLGDSSVKLTKESVLVSSSELQLLYKNLLMADLEEGVKNQIENFMWTDCFKTPLTFFMKQDNTLFHWMIEVGVGFYLGFIQDVGIHFDIPFIRNSVRNLYGTSLKSKQTWKSMPSKASIYYIIQNSMVHVGDLLRYRGSFLEALKMYEKSASICPNNGHPYNQMGLVQLHIDSMSVPSLLTGIYCYIRSLSVSNPFLPAQDNLISLFNKVNIVVPHNKDEEFMQTFLLGIAKLSSLPSLGTTGFVSLLVKKSLTFEQVFRILAIGLWAWKKELDKNVLMESLEEPSNGIELMIFLINGLIGALLEFQDLITSRYLSHLKILVDWLRLNPDVLKNETFRNKLDVNGLCRLTNRLVPNETTFVEIAKDMALVILPEEKKLLGFIPITKAYDHLMIPIEEHDGRIFSLRVGRYLLGMDVLADSKPILFERNILTREYKMLPPITPIGSSSFRFSFPAPSRRNMALQSIFSQIVTNPIVQNGVSLPLSQADNSMLSEEEMTDPKPSTGTIGDGRRSRHSPVPSLSDAPNNPPTPIVDIFSYSNDQTPPNIQQGITATPSSGSLSSDEFNSSDLSSIFTSIWTPFSEIKSEGGWK